VEYAPGGWALFVSGTSLIAQKLDLGAGMLAGQKITLVDDLRVGAASGHFSISRNGVIAFQHAGGTGGLELHLADRAGALSGPVLVTGELGNPRLAPDGRRVLYERRGPPGSTWGDVSVYDLERGTDTRLTFTEGQAVCAQWSPDGRRFAYTRAAGDGHSQLVLGSSDGLGAQDSIETSGSSVYLSQWAEAGSRLVGYSDTGRPMISSADSGGRKVGVLFETPGVMVQEKLSPDGRWVAGTVGAPPDLYVYVQSLEGPAGRWQISPAPGRKAVWTKGGKELVYEGMDGRLMAVDIDTREGFHAGTPHALFQLPLASFSREITTWSCDANAGRFVLVTPERSRAAGRTIEVMTDFKSLVNRK
jgi:Tol biopolymer transport system component